MPFRWCLAALAVSLAALTVAAQESAWTWSHHVELRANYRDSAHEKLPLAFEFPPEFLPIGQQKGFEETPDAGSHFELSVVNVQLDASYGTFFTARAKVHAQDKYRRNPTSSDRKIDADELYLRFGDNPPMLELPERTSLFVQAGKFPKMERQPTRLLESYGLAATAFNRMEDVQVLVGGSVGRNLYWRLQAANGNPLFFRDPNALAGDNGQPELRKPNPDPRIKSGFPILYNAETEDLFFDTSHVQYGEGLGYRWRREDGSAGFDAIAFHYRRSMADEENLTGTFYGGDLDLLTTPGGALPFTGRKKEEYGARVYGEWRALSGTVQFTKQHLAGLQRQGYEIESGYAIPLSLGPLRYVQPAARLSGLTNRFRGPATFVAPSVWWPWTKIDAGLRVGFSHGVDVTLEHTKSNIGAKKKLNMRETLVTVRVRV